MVIPCHLVEAIQLRLKRRSPSWKERLPDWKESKRSSTRKEPRRSYTWEEPRRSSTWEESRRSSTWEEPRRSSTREESRRSPTWKDSADSSMKDYQSYSSGDYEFTKHNLSWGNIQMKKARGGIRMKKAKEQELKINSYAKGLSFRNLRL